jgi:hypothetical protein
MPFSPTAVVVISQGSLVVFPNPKQKLTQMLFSCFKVAIREYRVAVHTRKTEHPLEINTVPYF